MKYNDHEFDPVTDEERAAREREEELARRIRREVLRVQSGEADEEIRADREREQAEEEARQEEQRKEERRRSNIFWLLFSGNILVRKGASEYYRYMICIAAMFFVSIFVMFTALHLDMKYSRLYREVQMLRERSTRLQEQRFRHTTHPAIPAELRRRGRRAPLAFAARTPAHAYSAFRVDAMQYLLLPVHQQELSALLARATEPEYGPAMTVVTAEGLRALAYAQIEYLECTHHVVHFHLLSGEDVVSLSLRVSFAEVAKPLLEDGRFLQPHRSYVVNLAAAQLLTAGELQMCSGARIPIPRGREGAVREAFRSWIDR